MAQPDPKNTRPDKQNEDAPLQPNPELLHTTDPEEHMKGPVSSIVQKIKEKAEENDTEKGENAEKKDK
jgi:hypothetical protein